MAAVPLVRRAGPDSPLDVVRAKPTRARAWETLKERVCAALSSVVRVDTRTHQRTHTYTQTLTCITCRGILWLMLKSWR